METLFQGPKSSVTKSITVKIPNTKCPFLISLEICLIVIGFVPFQFKIKGILESFWYNSCVFTTNEHKLCTTHRKLSEIV